MTSAAELTCPALNTGNRKLTDRKMANADITGAYHALQRPTKVVPLLRKVPRLQHFPSPKSLAASQHSAGIKANQGQIQTSTKTCRTLTQAVQEEPEPTARFFGCPSQTHTFIPRRPAHLGLP
ncbi:hypothetical protein CORC01_13940 [Colletotrichum orchidophilum]|uniref:Uncharacterized protein n=1 Tax=Colletotrichum orchidophilum TaxID=1209926 RepID=A0A1G4ANJ8_9PEZI|nr:uncharacterized protein CORC01_13940 [Colletotrichum orchidophilum]OHE90768.1 hypothetical protein CORC01_13940 [Colletotrichum orchidophilum]